MGHHFEDGQIIEDVGREDEADDVYLQGGLDLTFTVPVALAGEKGAVTPCA